MLPFVAYLIMNLLFYWAERYKIVGYELSLLKVVQKVPDGCTALSENCSPCSDTSGTYILKVTYKVEYVSLEHENLYIDYTQFPKGNKGSADSIRKIDINIQGLTFSADSLKDASEYSNFLVDGKVLQNHNSTGKCYSADAYKNINEFIHKVNAKQIGHSIINDQFYLIPGSWNKLLKSKDDMSWR